MITGMTIFETRVPGGVKVSNTRQANVRRLMPLVTAMIIFPAIYFAQLLVPETIVRKYWIYVIAVSIPVVSILRAILHLSRDKHRLVLTTDSIAVIQSAKKGVSVPLREVLFFDYYTPHEDPENSQPNEYELVIITNDQDVYFCLKNLSPKKIITLLNEIYRLGYRVNMMNEDLQLPYSSYFQPERTAE